MLRKCNEQDYDLIVELISKINLSAEEIFKGSYDTGELKHCFIHEDTQNKGVVTIIEREDFIVCQISFIEDCGRIEILEGIHNVLKKEIESKDEKGLFLNVYGRNNNIIEYFRKNNFEKSMSGIQYKISLDGIAKSSNNEILGELELKKFEESRIYEYIGLLDEGFKELSLACDSEPYWFSRNREKTIPWLKDFHEKDNFGAFWLDGELIGLYTLYKNYISNLVTHPNHQSKGFGSRTLKVCLNEVEKKGYDKVYLNCIDENKKAHKFYIRNGFVENGCFNENAYKG